MASVRWRQVRPRWARHECPGRTRHPQWLSSLHQIYLRNGREWFTSILGRWSLSIHFAGCLHHHHLSETNIHWSHDQLAFIRAILLQESKRGEYDSPGPVRLLHLLLARHRVGWHPILLFLEWLSIALRRHPHRYRLDQILKQKQPNLPVAGCERQRLYVDVPFIGNQTEPMKEKIQHLTESIRPDLDVRFVAKPPRAVQTFFPTKDRVPKHLQSNTVYATTCKECGDTYVGMTKRQTVTRLCEHGAPKETFDRKTNNNQGEGETTRASLTKILSNTWSDSSVGYFGEQRKRWSTETPYDDRTKERRR